MKKIILSFLVVFLCGCNTRDEPQPFTQGNSLILDRFIDMDIAENESVWAVSDDGTVVYSDIYYREGRRKSIENFGYLTGIDMISNTNGWAIAGINGIMHWDGKNWEKYTSADLSKTTPLLDIDFVNENSGWIVGCDFHNEDASSVLLYWNGAKWDKISLYASLGYDIFCLTAVDAISETNTWIVGKKTDTSFASIVLHWDGNNWTEIFTPSSMQEPHTISATSNDNVWVGSLMQNIFHWNGETWSHFELPIAHSETLAQRTFALLSISPDNVWAGGKQLFHWDGTTWENKNYNGHNGNIVAIQSAPNGNVWALTDTGVVMELAK
ncbi:MAG: hypothetical protein U0X74_07075 [Anaerolineales bacterium]